MNEAVEEHSYGEITQLLLEWSQGDSSTLEKLIPLVVDDLREIAGRLLRRESEIHTLQPTALVHEVYLRLFDQRNIQWQNSEQFFGVAALMMRRILVDYAKGRQSAKRGGGVAHLPLDNTIAEMQPDFDMVRLDQALNQLAEIDPRQSRIVEMRFFMGLSHEEIAEVLQISVTTVKREWKAAKLWLYHELKAE
ncbi:MAG TPA: sigma-70 family RNA polymerase sigma factor [Thermoanaerobaculia bacterium]|nr:sigma-70 family RNA polymerase sigma factor [Thermoanaerobaculia bacterium]